MTKFGKIILVVVLLALLGGVVYFLQKEPKEEVVEVSDDLVFENEILGNKFDLINFSVLPGSNIAAGELAFNGTIQGAYFFEGNIQISILDQNKNVLKGGYATATGEWMTAGPVDFAGTIDLTGLPQGSAYFEIHNDNASGLPENDKFIQIPINIQ
jgi:hypothetical protein